jgi:hypothetical protein
MLMNGCSVEKTSKIMVGMGTVTGIALIVLGVLRIWGGLGGCIIGAWVLYSAYTLWRSLENGQVREHPLYENEKDSQGTAMSFQNNAPPKGPGPTYV